MLTAGWFWLTIAIGVFWALGAYNRLVRLQSQVQQSFDALELRLLEFAELVQQVLSEGVISSAPWRSELNLDQGASHWSRLQECARHLAMELAHMQEHPLRADSVVRLSLIQTLRCRKLSSAGSRCLSSGIIHINHFDESISSI